jgi:HK97 family phage prohead protease
MDKIIRKSFETVSKAVDLEQGIFEAMITTEATDRTGDIVRAHGADIANYMMNPVVMWAHDYTQPPIGKTLSIEVIAGTGLKARFQFPPVGTYEHADTIHRLWAGGFINATSIGFQPKQGKGINGDTVDGREFDAWELLEFSIVPIPANQEALRMAIKAFDVPEQKVGRVLSASNERKLKAAADAINEVLAQLAPEQESIKYNDNHDENGRFASGDSSGGGGGEGGDAGGGEGNNVEASGTFEGDDYTITSDRAIITAPADNPILVLENGKNYKVNPVELKKWQTPDKSKTRAYVHGGKQKWDYGFYDIGESGLKYHPNPNGHQLNNKKAHPALAHVATRLLMMDINKDISCYEDLEPINTEDISGITPVIKTHEAETDTTPTLDDANKADVDKSISIYLNTLMEKLK